MKPALQFRLHQQLTLTPQLQLAIRLLQLSQLELEAELRQLAEGNPLLEFAEENEDEAGAGETAPETDYAPPSGPAEAAANDVADRDEGGDWSDDGGGSVETPIDFSSGSGSGNNSRGDEDFEPQSAAPETLQQHLLWQLNLAGFNPRQTAIATVMIDALNADGYLAEGIEAVRAALPGHLAADLDEIEAVRRRLQGFDPVGVASLDLRDCLRSQLEQFDPATPQRGLALAIVDGELELLARNDIAKLARKLHAGEDDTAAAAALIRSLDPRPGAALDTTPVEYVAPDVYAVREGSRWQVRLNPDAQPRLGLNQHYCNLIARARGDDASWMKGQLQEARWLLKSLESRADTLLKVAGAIVQRQSAFLDYGPEAMHPLVLREVAEEVGMHESTISRVTTRKYLHTPRGTFELKYFFSSGVSTEDGGSASATAIQAMLRKLIDAEDVRKPLSDQALAEELKSKGIQVARRTVAKYREGLRIPSSSERQRIG
ncbi:MAG: RNA polymerase sigma-54 factor [Rhodanobacter sp. 68-29]|uniref:RNA polymerase factor sigma-54 n=1 Tax=Rhodanobacter sp. PCA2 TaxID=2006117 RepID=UPI00086EEB2D|nr:RNA polymerase factor sigma-54 [Rhodanobacter sp. PCA2]MBA2079228.1 RNA polymerase sigma-54 factor [Rhodanobacter sp. PCA2]MBN8922187.1 RNA polymerase factor sigma-54 [Rhodanobacter sp.]ODU73469.1 MAG: RNA polymerase sigma-54 factor [Rhodanobacter sp. SCN 69-32]OJY55928.1 MAG: RNA polymerase sigma-54 factor [Rhodanobacter sp. 68-29]